MHASTGAGRVVGGRYRLREPIGRGAMGTVWRAQDELLDRDVAVKEMKVPPALSEDDRQLLARLSVFQVQTERPQRYLAVDPHAASEIGVRAHV